MRCYPLTSEDRLLEVEALLMMGHIPDYCLDNGNLTGGDNESTIEIAVANPQSPLKEGVFYLEMPTRFLEVWDVVGMFGLGDDVQPVGL
jgi:hypothetical protein